MKEEAPMATLPASGNTVHQSLAERMNYGKKAIISQHAAKEFLMKPASL